jgi:hypothetical protein
LTGQREVPIHAESNTEFFAKVVDAQISFVPDVNGQATSLVLHQGGGHHSMKRIDAPNYDEMSPALAEATRRQLPNLQPGHEELGAVQSVTFLGVGRQGEDVYTVRHENGASHWRIALDSKGVISTAWVSPGP